MFSPINAFKQSLGTDRRQIGFWLALDSPTVTEICGGAGFDWCVIDAEHGPSDERDILAQLHALGGGLKPHPIVRIPTGFGSAGQVWIKRVLDLGVETLLIPMVEDADQASSIVRAARYPDGKGQGGRRGVAPMRAARWGRWTDYIRRANERLCIIVQVETERGLGKLKDIANVDGVDAIFLGPADLAASLGCYGDTQAPRVMRYMEEATRQLVRLGKPVGSISTDPVTAGLYFEWGMSFVAVGVDVGVLARGVDSIYRTFAGD